MTDKTKPAARVNKDGNPLGVQLTHAQIMASNAKRSEAAKVVRKKPGPKPKVVMEINDRES
jgi:hypothetical protein